MSKLIFALVALAIPAGALPASAFAQVDVSAAFGATVVSTYPDGRKAHLKMKADGSYTATGRRGKPSSGTWSIKGDKVCLKQKKPTPAPFTYCTPAPTGGIGTSWKAKAVTGEPITVTVVKD